MMRLLDLGCNDGFVLANLCSSSAVYDRLDGIDLHPGNVALARERQGHLGWQGEIVCGDVHDAADHFKPGSYDAVVAFELIEHVLDPSALLVVMRTMVAPGGRLLVSTPDGAVEQGNLPGWHVVERKGHVRALREQDLIDLCREVGDVEMIVRGLDRVLVAVVAPR